MDTNTALLGTGTGGSLFLIALYIYKSVVGKKLRSRCCGKDVEVGFVVEDMSPAASQKNPMRTRERDLPIDVVVP
jgi:hypothetical protein